MVLCIAGEWGMGKIGRKDFKKCKSEKGKISENPLTVLKAILSIETFWISRNVIELLKPD